MTAFDALAEHYDEDTFHNDVVHHMVAGVPPGAADACKVAALDPSAVITWHVGGNGSYDRAGSALKGTLET